jgi:flagellar basal body-associated protein FliL
MNMKQNNGMKKLNWTAIIVYLVIFIVFIFELIFLINIVK